MSRALLRVAVAVAIAAGLATAASCSSQEQEIGPSDGEPKQVAHALGYAPSASVAGSMRLGITRSATI